MSNNYNYFENSLKHNKITKDEFLSIYEMSDEEREKALDKMEKRGIKRVHFIHLLIAYHNTYPEKKKEYDKRKGR